MRQQPKPFFLTRAGALVLLCGLAFGAFGTAAEDAQTTGVDLAYGAFQRGEYITALRLALERAKTGDAVAETLIGLIYQEGLGVPRKADVAAEWYQLAANKGNAHAQFAYGLALLEGRGVSPDIDGGIAWIEKAAIQKNGDALVALGLIHQGPGEKQNLQKALHYYTQSAETGDPRGQYRLGLMYLEGDGVEKNERLGAQWIAQAAFNHLPEAQVQYGILIFNGRGIKKDETIAAAWLIRAALQRNPVAQARLARLYTTGRGIERNLIRGLAWYYVALSAGLKDEFMEEHIKTLSSEQIDQAHLMAARLFKSYGHLEATN